MKLISIYFILHCTALQGGYIDYPFEKFSNSAQSFSADEYHWCDLFYEECNKVCDDSICDSPNSAICTTEILACETSRSQNCNYFIQFNCIPRVSFSIFIEVLLFLSVLPLFILCFLKAQYIRIKPIKFRISRVPWFTKHIDAIEST